jgi:hypothetical protein
MLVLFLKEGKVLLQPPKPNLFFIVEISCDVLSLSLVASKNQSSSQEHGREKEKDKRQA